MPIRRHSGLDTNSLGIPISLLVVVILTGKPEVSLHVDSDFAKTLPLLRYKYLIYRPPLAIPTLFTFVLHCNYIVPVCVYVLLVLHIMATKKPGPVDSWPKRPCPGDCTNILIRGEKHEKCFDCMNHGPMSIRDLRCEICFGWTPKQFVSATSRYAESSLAKQEAKTALERDNKDSSPPVTLQEERVETPDPMDTTEPLPNPTPGVSNPQPTPTPPGILVTPEQLQENIAAVLRSLGVVPPVGESGRGKRKESGVSSHSSSDSTKKPKKNGRPPCASVSRESDLTAGRFNIASERSSVGRQMDIPSGRYDHDVQGTALDHSAIGLGTQGPHDRYDSDALGAPLNHNAFDRGSRDSIAISDQGLPIEQPIDSHGRQPGMGYDARLGASLTASQHTGLLGAANYPAMHMLTGRGAASGIARLAHGRGASRRSDLIDLPAAYDRGKRASKSSLPHSVTGSQISIESDSESDRDETSETRSNFRWALESIYTFMGRTLKEPAPSVGTGRFATKPKREQISLPMATALVDHCTGINRAVTVIKDNTGRSEPSFPSISCRASAQDTYASETTDGCVTRAPRDDEVAGLIPRKKSAVWSASIKKTRLASWQTISHHLMGQLSTSDHLTALVQEILDDADISDEVASRAQAALSVLLSTIQNAEKFSATLAAQLDITAREADLRTFDLCDNDVAKLRARPLFEGRTFAGLTDTEVDTFRSNRREEALLEHVASKAKPAREGKKSKPTSTSTSSSMTAEPSTSTRQPFRTNAPPKKGGKSKSGRGRGSKSKSQ